MPRRGGVCLAVYQRVVAASRRVVIKARCGMSSPHTAIFVSPHGQTQLDVTRRSSLPPPAPCKTQPPPAVLPSRCKCKLCKCRGSGGDEAYSRGISARETERERESTSPGWHGERGLGRRISCAKCIFNWGFQSSLARHGEDMGVSGFTPPTLL